MINFSINSLDGLNLKEIKLLIVKLLSFRKSNPRVVEHLQSSRPLIGLDLEDALDEGLIYRIGDPLELHISLIDQSLQLVIRFCFEGVFSLSERKGDNSKRPNVCLLPDVLLLAEDLWSHVVRSATNRIQLPVFIG